METGRFYPKSPCELCIVELDRLMRAKPQLKDRRFKTWYGDTQQDTGGGNEDEDDDDYGMYGGADGDQPDEYDPLVKVGRLLLRLGKVTYKHVEPLPLWMRRSIFVENL